MKDKVKKIFKIVVVSMIIFVVALTIAFLLKALYHFSPIAFLILGAITILYDSYVVVSNYS